MQTQCVLGRTLALQGKIRSYAAPAVVGPVGSKIEVCFEHELGQLENTTPTDRPRPSNQGNTRCLACHEDDRIDPDLFQRNPEIPAVLLPIACR